MTSDQWIALAAGLLGGALRVGVPFLFVSLGECLTEKSGRINLGLEGVLVLSAMAAFGGAYLSGSPWVGVLAGAVEVAAVHTSANSSLIAGYGYAGILVAFIARHNPLAVIPVAILFGGFGAAGSLLQRRLGLPDASVMVLQGIAFVFILASEALRDVDWRAVLAQRLRPREPSPVQIAMGDKLS